MRYGLQALEQPRRPGLERLEPAGQLSLKLDRDERAALTSRPHGFSNRLFNTSNVSSSRHDGLFREAVQVRPLKALLGQAAVHVLRQERRGSARA